MTRLAGLGLCALVVLHQDTWFWADDRRVMGLPVGLLYHVGLCVLASIVFYGLASNLTRMEEEG